MSERGYKIYAVDFDGTLCANAFPEIGEPNTALINHLIKRRNQGNKIILWTCRTERKCNEAVEWCCSQGLEFDAVNENLPEVLKEWGGREPKDICRCLYRRQGEEQARLSRSVCKRGDAE